jgi:hypothetical protein
MTTEVLPASGPSSGLILEIEGTEVAKAKLTGEKVLKTTATMTSNHE